MARVKGGRQHPTSKLARRQKQHDAGPPPESDAQQRYAWGNGGRKRPGSQNRDK